MKLKCNILCIMLLLLFAAPLRAYHCSQIPADCICMRYPSTFLACLPGSFFSCFPVLIVRGRLLSHPEDTASSGYRPRGEFGRFVVEEVIAPVIKSAAIPDSGDTLETAMGGSCYSWYQPDSVECIVGLSRDHFPRDSTVPPCYYFPGCTNFRLSYKSSLVIGPINSGGIDTMPYADFKQLIAAKIGTAGPGRRMGTLKNTPGISLRRAGDRLIINGNFQSEHGNLLYVGDLKGRMLMQRTIRNPDGTFIVPANVSTGSVLVVRYGGVSHLVVVR